MQYYHIMCLFWYQTTNKIYYYIIKLDRRKLLRSHTMLPKIVIKNLSSLQLFMMISNQTVILVNIMYVLFKNLRFLLLLCEVTNNSIVSIWNMIRNGFLEEVMAYFALNVLYWYCAQWKKHWVHWSSQKVNRDNPVYLI